MAIENEGINSSSSAAAAAAAVVVNMLGNQIISSHNNNDDINNIHLNTTTAITTTAQILTTPILSTSISSSSVLTMQQQQQHKQQQQQPQSSSLINGNCSGNSSSIINNCSNNINNTSNNISNNNISIGSGNGNGGIHSISTNNIIGISSKSETSSNASVNGSIKKASSSSSNTLMNSSSREDVTSIGGNSSVNSHSTTNNNNIIIKGPKDNLHGHFYNGLPPPGRYHPHNILSEGDGLGPLPPKWEKAYTENGELYFIDHNTGTSHWLDPRLSKFQKKSLEDCMDDELPYGWEKIDDPQYGTYFIDHVNRRTQYENPVLEAKRRIERNRNDKQQQLPLPPPLHKQQSKQQLPLQKSPNPIQSTTYFTRNPAEMRGERITTTLLKSSRGLGITIVGGDDNDEEEFLQIKSIVPNGPAWLDGKLQTGDILVYVNDTCVLGFTHHEMVNVFQSILPGETVTLEICRDPNCPLPFDPNDPNTEVVTTIAVDGISSSDPEKTRILMDLNMDGNYNFLDISDSAGAVGGQLPQLSQHQQQQQQQQLQKNPLAKIQAGSLSTPTTPPNNDINNENYIGDDRIILKKPEILKIAIVKGIMGFGFTIADSAYGQKVKKILDRNCCKNLQEGDILLEINSTGVKHMSHSEVVQVLKDCPKTKDTTVKVQRGHYFDINTRLSNGSTGAGGNKLKKSLNKDGGITSIAGMYRSKTPTADLYSTQQKEILPIRPKTPLVDTRRARAKTPSNELNDEVEAVTSGLLENKNNNNIDDRKSMLNSKSTNSLQEIDSINNDIPFMDPYPKLVTTLTERLAEASMLNDNHNNLYQHPINQHHHHISQSRLTSSGGVVPVSGNNGSNIGGNGGYDTNSIAQEYTTYATSGPYVNSPITNGGNGTVADNSNDGLYSPPPPMPIMAHNPNYHQDSCYCYECQDYNRYQLDYQNQTHHQQFPPPSHHLQSGYGHNSLPHNNNNRLHHQNQKRLNEFIIDRRKIGFRPLENHHHPQQQQQQQISAVQQQQQHYGQMPIWKYELAGNSQNLIQPGEDEYTLSEVTLDRQALGFGFRIVGGTEEGSQVTVGHIVPGGAADCNPRIATGDEILSIDGVNVVSSSHHKVVSLMGEAAHRGHVTMILRRRVNTQQQQQHHRLHFNPNTLLPIRSIQYPYDVIVSRYENEGFGFVIISSSNQFYGSTIGKLIPGSPADRCGDLKVGDRIIAVNRIEIAGMSHGEVVNLIKESGLHVRLTIGCPQEGGPNTVGVSGGGIIGISGNPIQQQQQTQQSPIIAALKADHQQQQQAAAAASIGQQYFDHRSQLTQHPQL